MKKVFIFCSFAFTLLIGSQSAFAQDNAEIDLIVTKKTKELCSKLKVDNITIEKIYSAYRDFEVNSQSIDTYLISGSKEYKSATEKNKLHFQKAMKEALSAELYDSFLTLSNPELNNNLQEE